MWKWWFAIKIGENQRKFRGISLEVLCLRSNDFLSGNTQMPKAIGTVRDAAEGRGDVYGARKGTWESWICSNPQQLWSYLALLWMVY